MFDLDQAIAEWRSQMVFAGVKAPEILDELENHLRDEIERQEVLGVTKDRAFEIAVESFGQAVALKEEFAKIRNRTSARVKDAIFALAGIPNQYSDPSMATSNAEPRWATYLKAAAFVAPAIVLWVLSVFFVVPKLKQICDQAGGYPLPGFIRVILGLTENGIWISAAIMLLLGLLEWRSTNWPRFRRATVGVGTFVLNSVILISIFTLFVLALTYAPALFRK